MAPLRMRIIPQGYCHRCSIDNHFYEFCLVQVAHKSCKSHKKKACNIRFYRKTSVGTFNVNQPANETGGSNSKTGVALRPHETEA